MAKEEDDPRRFLHPTTIARISRLDLRAQHVVEGFISGMHRSPFFGHSVEFVQHREYVSGDDLRHLDWKVWSKTDKFYIKQFEEETNLRSHLVVDVSNSMHYGRGALNKYNYGCTIAACLAYLVIRQQDSAALVTFDETVRQILPARSAPNQWSGSFSRSRSRFQFADGAWPSHCSSTLRSSTRTYTGAGSARMASTSAGVSPASTYACCRKASSASASMVLSAR